MSPTMLYDTIVPSVVKKYASGKTIADKQLMYDSFVKHTGVDLMKMFDMNKLNNPVTDIIDSYYIAKVGNENSVVTTFNQKLYDYYEPIIYEDL